MKRRKHCSNICHGYKRLVLALLLAAGILGAIPMGVLAETQPDAADEPWRKNVLENKREFEQDGLWYTDNPYIPGTGRTLRNNVWKIIFLDSTKDAPRWAADASQARDRSVRSWVEYKAAKMYLYIAADGGICLPEDCTELFSSYESLVSIEFNGNVHLPDQPAYLSELFAGCRELESLDLSGLDTGQVLSMASMFRGCKKLKSVNLSGWDTGNVLTMANMFKGCDSLESLDLSGFDTSQVLDMGGMLLGCDTLDDLNLGQWETDSLLHYGTFMEAEKRYNGESWESIFQ